MYQANGEYGVYTQILSLCMYLSINLIAYLETYLPIYLAIYPSIDRPMKVEGMATPLTVVFWSFWRLSLMIETATSMTERCSNCQCARMRRSRVKSIKSQRSESRFNELRFVWGDLLHPFASHFLASHTFFCSNHLKQIWAKITLQSTLSLYTFY